MLPRAWNGRWRRSSGAWAGRLSGVRHSRALVPVRQPLARARLLPLPRRVHSAPVTAHTQRLACRSCREGAEMRCLGCSTREKQVLIIGVQVSQPGDVQDVLCSPRSWASPHAWL